MRDRKGKNLIAIKTKGKTEEKRKICMFSRGRSHARFTVGRMSEKLTHEVLGQLHFYSVFLYDELTYLLAFFALLL